MPTSDDQLLDLLSRHAQSRKEGKEIPLEVLCADCPELLDAVRHQISLEGKLLEAAGVPLDTGVFSGSRQTWSEEGNAVSSAGREWPSIPGYEIQGELGKGGMGAVYRALDTRLKRVVALKVIRPGMVEPTALARFQGEGEALARLNHPHIVQIYEVGTWQPAVGGRVPYLALEFVEGGSLQSRLTQQPMPESEAIKLVALVARAIQAAHAADIIHRDLKPDNILLGPIHQGGGGNTSLGWPKVTDFGLARRLLGEGLTETGALLGTPAYMAPEQVDGAATGPPTDVWALGAILYRLLSGQTPFTGDSMIDLLHRIRSEAPRSLRDKNRLVSPELEALCLACLQRDPAKRPSAGELAGNLEQWQHHVPTKERVLPQARARPRLSPWLLVPVCLLPLVVALFTQWKWPKADSAAPTMTPADASVTFKGFLDAEMSRPGDPARQNVPLRETSARPLRAGDAVRIHAQLNLPAHLYILWIDSKGEVMPAYPWSDWKWQERGEDQPRKEVHLPWKDNSWKWWEMDDGPAGLETMVLLARETPLPADVDLKAALADLPRQLPFDKAGSVVAWFENGLLVRDEVMRGPKLGIVKDGVSSLERINQEVQGRIGSHFRYTRAVTFGNLGSEK